MLQQHLCGAIDIRTVRLEGAPLHFEMEMSQLCDNESRRRYRLPRELFASLLTAASARSSDRTLPTDTHITFYVACHGVGAVGH